ncbi:MAG: alpha/beta hydrolase [Planctomycetota bacterium]
MPIQRLIQRSTSPSPRPAAVALTCMLAALTPAAAAQSHTQPQPTARPAVQPAVQTAGQTGTRVIRTDDDVALHVRVMGEAAADTAPVLLLTGGPGFSGGYLEPVARHIAKAHAAILPDQRGTGASGPDPFDPAAFSIERSVADIEQIRVALGHERLTLVGHSWGGILSMHYAAAHPERVANLVLLNSGGIDPTFMRGYQTNITARMNADDIEALGEIMPTEQTLEAYAESVRAANRAMAGGMTATPQAAAELREKWMREDQFNARVALIMQRALQSYDLKPTIGRYTGPATVVHGELDPIGLATAEVIAAAIEGARLVTIDGAAHWPFMETPEAFFAALDAALQAALDPAPATD